MKQKNRLALFADIFIIGGAIAVSAGVCLIHLAAGIIVAGLLSIAGGITVLRGDSD